MQGYLNIIFSRIKNRNIIYSFLGNFFPIFCAFVFIPYIKYHLGDQDFGAVVLMWALIGYFGIFDLGISKALVYHTARIKGSTNELLEPVVKYSIKWIIVVTLIFSLALFIWAEEFCRIFLRENVGPHSDLTISFQIVAIAISFTTVGNALRGVLEGLSDFKSAAVIKAVTFSAYFYIPAALAPFDLLTLSNTAAGYLIVRIISCGWSWRVVTRSLVYRREKHASSHRLNFREIFSYGLWALVTSIISPLMVYGDRFVISAVVGASLVGIYAILQETIGRSLIAASSYCAVLQPDFTRSNDGEWYDLYVNSERTLGMLLAAMYFGVILTARPLLEWWLADDFAEYISLIGIFTVALFFNSMAQLPYAVLLGRGKPDWVAKTHAVEFLFYLPICWCATQAFGLQGAAAAWLLRVLVDYGILRWLVKRIKH